MSSNLAYEQSTKIIEILEKKKFVTISYKMFDEIPYKLLLRI